MTCPTWVVGNETKDRNLSQEHWAELSSLNPRTIQKIEAGKLDILLTTLVRLHAALTCEWDELMEGI